MIILFIVLLVLAGTTLAYYFSVYAMRRREKNYLEEIKQTRRQLMKSIVDLDTFMASLTNIHRFSMDVTSFSSVEALGQHIILTASELFNFRIGSVMLLNPGTGQLDIIAGKGISREIVSRTHLHLGEGVAGKVVETGKPISVKDIATDPRFTGPASGGYEWESLISVPLQVNRKIIGVLNIHPVIKDDVYDSKFVHLLSVFADQSAVALENISLYNNLHRSYLEIVKTLARASDLKDSYSYDHADRANKLAYLVCSRLNLPKCISRQIEYAALVHDVGKIGIDSRILDKPSMLDKQEREKIEKHPILGSNLVAPIPFLSSIAPIIRYHQEWYNGEGYPEGLKGEEIPLGSRIVSVIDAYDAMTSDRPYRKRLDFREAAKELRKCAGIQFDPYIVDIFIEVVGKLYAPKENGRTVKA